MKQIYIIRSGEYYKVGITNNVKKRLGDLQVGNPVKLEVIRAFTVHNPYLREDMVHQALKDYHVRGEWFQTIAA